MRRFIKKLSLSILLLATVVSILVSLSSCAFLLPKVSDKLPDEEIIKVEKVTEITYDNIVYQELPEEKIPQFKENLQKLKYRKWYNWKGLLLAFSDDEWVLITYENFTVQLGEKKFYLRTRDTSEVIEVFTIDALYPDDTLANIFALFED